MTTFSEQELEEARFMAQQLSTVLGNDNAARKEAEAHLKKIREGDPNKYAGYLSYIIAQADAPPEARTLGCVILRRSLTSAVVEDKTLWDLLADQPKEYMKSQILESVQTATTKDLVNKMCDLLVEIAAAIYEETDQTWQPLFALIFKLVNSDNINHISGGLNCLNGLFAYMIDEFNNTKDDLLGIFGAKLQHPNLDIQLATLQAISSYLGMAQRKFTKPYRDLIPAMLQVVMNANKADDEVVLKEALVEFNEIAEFEPKFFEPKFKEIFEAFSQIVENGDFTDPLVRHQPLDFFVMTVERLPNICAKDDELLRRLFDLVFKLMIDIDSDIEESWMRPKEGFIEEAEDGAGEGQSDNLHFGKSCIDNIVASVGDQKCLPHLSAIVNQLMANDSDWRYKNAALMAFSQVGEYIEDINIIQPMLELVASHLKHQNPKVRFAAVHCIGQMSDDMSKKFQAKYGDVLLPAMIETLNDPVPRVSAHMCSAFSNFAEGSTCEQLWPHLDILSKTLGNLMQNGISLQKEHAVSAFATIVVKIEEKFDPYFSESIQLLLNCMNTHMEPAYKQYRAQIIEAISLISSTVSKEVFMTAADSIVATMVTVQKSQMEDNAPERVYLLSAWQRICVIMREKFTPYLDEIMPSILSMALLKPSMGVEGVGEGEIEDILNEIRPTDDKTSKKINLNTDELEDKDTALRMIVVFVEELGVGFAKYLDQASEILLSMTKYSASATIRTSAVAGLPCLVKTAKEAQPGHISGLHDMAKAFCNNILEAMDMETETECLTAQTEAIKEIMGEAGNNMLQPESVTMFHEKIFQFIQQSENRSNETRRQEAEEREAEDDERLDDEDLAVFKDEIREENELQSSLVEVLGILFKTHKEHCKPLADKIINEVLPLLANHSDKAKQKFLLYILDDMLEYLDADFLGLDVYHKVALQVASKANSPSPAIRQAAVYGIGMAAQHGGAGFAGVHEACLGALKAAVEYPLDDETREKSKKMFKFAHARDNAVAALGRVIKYQGQHHSTPQVTSTWLSLMPLTHDMVESKEQNQQLAEMMMANPSNILGANNEGLEHFVTVLGTICDEEQSNADTLMRLSVIIADLFQDANLGPQCKAIAEGKLTEEQKNRVQDTYNKCNEEIRQQVAAMGK